MWASFVIDKYWTDLHYIVYWDKSFMQRLRGMIQTVYFCTLTPPGSTQTLLSNPVIRVNCSCEVDILTLFYFWQISLDTIYVDIVLLTRAIKERKCYLVGISLQKWKLVLCRSSSRSKSLRENLYWYHSTTLYKDWALWASS